MAGLTVPRSSFHKKAWRPRSGTQGFACETPRTLHPKEASCDFST